MLTPNLNLRPDPDTGLFIPTKSVKRFSESSITPLIALPEGDMLLCYSGSTLYILDRSNDTIVMSHDTGSRIQTAEICGTRCVVYLSTGQLILNHTNDDGWVAEPVTPFPEVRIKRSGGRYAEVSVGERKLSGSYGLTDHILNATDNSALTADLLEGYRELRLSTDAARMFVQPVVVRCRYLDNNGRTIFVTPAVMLTPDGGFQCTSTITTAIDSSTGTRGGVTLTAESYRMEVEFPAAVRHDVAKVLIEATPQLEIVNFNGMAPTAVMRGTDGRLVIRTSLPISPSTAEGIQMMAQSVIEHADSLFRTVAHVNAPFDGKGHTLTFGAEESGSDDLKSAITEMRKTLATPFREKSTNGITGGGNVPHTVTCSAVAKNGDTLLMGDLTLLPFRGYCLDTFGNSFSDEKWKGAIAVEFAGEEGETVVRYCDGNTGSPTLLSPVLSYPRADATSMRIFFQSGGKCYERRFILTPSRSGDCAFYVNPGLEPIDMTENESEFFIVTAEKPVGHRYPGTVATACTSTPSAPYCFRTLSNSRISAVSHALGSASGWDYVRSRFYIFSPDGTFTVITDDDTIRGINKVDSRGVSNGENVVGVTRRGVAVLTDSGDLLLWRGIAPVSAGRSLDGRLGFDAVHDEFWLFGDDRNLTGPAEKSAPFDSAVVMERTFSDSVISLHHLPEGTIVRGRRGLYMLGEEYSSEELVNVRFIRSLPVAAPVRGATVKQRRRGRRLRGVKLVMQSPGPADITISVRGDNGAGLPYSPSFCRFRVRGVINSPLLFHTPSPHLHTVHLTAEGDLPSDSSITDFETLTESYEI